MIRDIVVSDKSKTTIIVREVLAHVASLVLLPFGIKKGQRRTARKKAQRTIILIHGYLGNRSSFFPLLAYLGLVGVGRVITFNYQWRTGIEQAALELRDFLRKNVRGGRIDFVCHSMGGVIARVYLQQLGGARRTDRCITLGTPHRGTYNAYWVGSRVGEDLRPDSRLMAKLEATRGAGAKVKFFSIIAGSDNIVIPRVFASNGEDALYIPNVGHFGMLFSPTVFQAIAKNLLGA